MNRMVRAIGEWLGLVDSRIWCEHCDHPLEAHYHFRAGLDCGICGCTNEHEPTAAEKIA